MKKKISVRKKMGMSTKKIKRRKMLFEPEVSLTFCKFHPLREAPNQIAIAFPEI
jgi:hypothetical protein